MNTQTFQQYLDDTLAECAEEDPDLDLDDLQKQYWTAIKQYGFIATDPIPATFIEILRKHIL